MPTYEYECRECGHSFEVSQSMSDEALKDCPLCGKAVRRLIFGGSGVIFKGSGFYVNDAKGSKAAAAKPATDSTAKKGDASPAEPACPAAKPESAQCAACAGATS